MEQWEHAITVHTVQEILAAHPKSALQPEGRVLYCGSEGTCFFDQAPNPYLAAIVKVLDARGQEGWMLVQVVLRAQDMICFWRRPRQEESSRA
jgi:hypothetical protein